MLKLENPLYVWGKFAIGSLRGNIHAGIDIDPL